MISSDMVNAKANQEGARAVDEIINTRLVAKITQQIADRMDAGKRVDSAYGAFYIDTNGHAFFEDAGHSNPDISVEFRTSSREMRYAS